MSEYNCNLYKELYDAYIDVELPLNPADYLECETESELKEEINYDLEDQIMSSHIYWSVSESKIDIPNEFIEEWKSLKHLNSK